MRCGHVDVSCCAAGARDPCGRRGARGGGEARILPNDDVVVRIGGDPPSAFLEQIGVRMVKKEIPLRAGCRERGCVSARRLRGDRGVRSRLRWRLLASRRPCARRSRPGRSRTAHAALEGTLNCAKCHGNGSGAMNAGVPRVSQGDRVRSLTSGRGFHAREGKGACASCHPDHAGADFALDEVAGRDRPSEFDHRSAGWTLEGKHADVACEKCHKMRIPRAAVAAHSRARTARAWVGLEPACRSCHEDSAQRIAGRECARCHERRDGNRRELRSRRSSVSAHRASTPTVRVREVPRGGATRAARRMRKVALVPVFKPVPHRDCADCHADPHKGRARRRRATSAT